MSSDWKNSEGSVHTAKRKYLNVYRILSRVINILTISYEAEYSHPKFYFNIWFWSWSSNCLLINWALNNLNLQVTINICDLKQTDCQVFFHWRWVYSGSAENGSLGPITMMTHVQGPLWQQKENNFLGR